MVVHARGGAAAPGVFAAGQPLKEWFSRAQSELPELGALPTASGLRNLIPGEPGEGPSPWCFWPHCVFREAGL